MGLNLWFVAQNSFVPSMIDKKSVWYDKFGLLSKNDRQRKRTLLFYKDGSSCHFEPFAKRRKIQRNLRHILNLWILRFAQYDKAHQYDKI